MPDAPSTTYQFWLLTGDVPTRLFTVAQIHDKLAAGDATWQTPANRHSQRPFLGFATPGLQAAIGDGNIGEFAGCRE